MRNDEYLQTHSCVIKVIKCFLVSIFALLAIYFLEVSTNSQIGVKRIINQYKICLFKSQIESRFGFILLRKVDDRESRWQSLLRLPFRETYWLNVEVNYLIKVKIKLEIVAFCENNIFLFFLFGVAVISISQSWFENLL